MGHPWPATAGPPLPAPGSGGVGWIEGTDMNLISPSLAPLPHWVIETNRWGPGATWRRAINQVSSGIPNTAHSDGQEGRFFWDWYPALTKELARGGNNQGAPAGDLVLVAVSASWPKPST